MIRRIPEIRRVCIRALTGWSWAITAIIASAAKGSGWAPALLIFVSVLLNLAPSALALRGDTHPASRILAAIVAVAQACLLSIMLPDAHWQFELHLLSIIMLVALIFLCDHRPVLAASFTIVAFETAVTFGALGPAAAANADWGHFAVHSGSIMAVGAILYIITREFDGIVSGVSMARQASEEQTIELQEKTAELEKALARLEKEREAREEVTTKIFEVRRSEYEQVANEFERTVSAVAHSVASTAKLLEDTTKNLDKVAHEAGDRASEVANSAEAATKAAHTVARGVAELSGSISNIAVNVSQQKEMTSRATERSSSGGEAVGSLAERSDTIGEATRAIVRIAERTNLLSLNAAIEAASAGPAGRGFTIVAQEVKALAQQAALAATEIDDLLSGVRSGTLEAERSFVAIEAVVAELDKAAIAIRQDVETQRQSADTIEGYARRAANDVDDMAKRSRSLSDTAQTAKQLTHDLDVAASKLMTNVKTLEGSAEEFLSRLRNATNET